MIIQNTNAYEVGFTAAWEGLRNALWKNRTPETEKPILGFLELDTIKSVYLHGHKKPELISPDNWNMDFRFMERPKARQVQMDLFYDYRTNVALYPHPRRRRCLPEGVAEGRDASARFGSLRGGGLPRLHLDAHAPLLP